MTKYLASNSLLIGVIVVLIIGVGGFYYIQFQSNQNLPSGNDQISGESMEDQMDSERMMTEDLAEGEHSMEGDMIDEAPSATSGQYVEYSESTLADSSQSRRVLFFYANWCPTCIPADEAFSENVSQIPSDTTLIRVNYNDSDTDQAEEDLAVQYNVTYQHTFVQIDSQGNEITKWNGGDIDELLFNIL